MKNQIRIKKIPLSLRNWFHDCFLGTELQAETARMLGVPNDLQSIAKAYIARHRANLRKAKVSKGFGGKR